MRVRSVKRASEILAALSRRGRAVVWIPRASLPPDTRALAVVWRVDGVSTVIGKVEVTL